MNTATTNHRASCKPAQTMSSYEIAELTGKQHKDVMRDIRVMFEQLEIGADLRSSFEGSFIDSMNREKPCYNLPRRECEILVTGYDVKRRAAVIDRWYALESGQGTAIQATHANTAIDNAKVAIQVLKMAQAYGFEGNQALLSADKATRNMVQFSPLEAMEQTALVSEVKALAFTPTQIGQMYEPTLSAREINKRLEKIGLQIGVGKEWVPTEEGKAYCEVLDTGKRHKTTGAPVKQVKWYTSVIEELKRNLS